MGNQLTGIAPSQILSVDHYLQDATDYEFKTSLGSTRFLKVATARCTEGQVVVKVFVIHDPSLPLRTYKDGIENLGHILNNASNVLPFQRATLSDKAAMLFRQYIKYSLYDRISTRPFLSTIEKQFLAFQLLCALNQCHSLGVCHGDIKSENVLVSSWNWVMLADFASFKPTYLPEDNPADFSYFFDTSRRRTCYIAPERFVKSSWGLEDSLKDSGKASGSIDLPTGDVQKGELTPAMDIFSAGCVITELFTEGSPPFDLSQLLAYREGEYSPASLVQKTDNVYIRDLVRHMMQKEPHDRLTAEEYMAQQKGRAFPDYFYTFLKSYLQRFASPPILTPDERIQRIKRDMSVILEKLAVSKTNPESNSGLLLIISMVTAAQRNLHFLKSKLTSLELLHEIAGYVTSDVVLERIIPFMLCMVEDTFSQVRCEAVRTITLCLANIESVPLTDANIFPEYILPGMAHLSQDSSSAVRVAYARNIAKLSHTAVRFLEIVQLNSQQTTFTSDTTTTTTTTINDSINPDLTQSKASYDSELRTLHEMIQKKVVTLLSDPDNAVKRTLLEHGITQLCVFFGRQKANDILLSHMITFLNNKEDWQLRGAFFDAIVGIAAFVGWHSSLILKPLLQQGLSDSEEFVIHKTLSALQSLVEQSLIQKPIKYELLTEVRLFLCHPNQWIRQGAVGFICALARSLNVADVHCNLMPAIEPFLRQKIIQVQDQQVLLSCLSQPLPRPVYDYILRSPHIERLFDCLKDRKLVRSFCRPGHSPQYSELDNTMGQVMRKLQSEGMSQEDEKRLLLMRELMLKLSRNRASSEPPGSEGESEGCVDLKSGLSSAKHRHADLKKIGEGKTDPQSVMKKPQTRKKTSGSDSTTILSEDWKQMFGTSEVHTDPSLTNTTSLKKPPSRNKKEGSPSPSVSRIIEIPPLGWGPYKEPGQSSAEMGSSSTVREQTRSPVPIAQKYAECRLDLQSLVYHKKELFTEDETTKDLISHMEWERRPPPAAWKPTGLLVAHLHEHRGAVNRVKVSQDHSYFATCSNDATVKVFDSTKMEGKSVTNRSRMTFNKSEGQIKTLTFCESSQSIAFVADKGDSGILNVFRIETGGPHKYTMLHSSDLPVETDGMVVDLSYLDHYSQNTLVYTTVHGYIIGRDLRTNMECWRLQNDPKQGLVTTFDVHPNRSWMVLGTSNGTMVCWDMRFHLPVTSITHPTAARCRRLLIDPTKSSTIISSMQGNNEVSFWDLETGSRQKTLWASTAPPLSQTKATNHSVNGLYFGKTDSNSFLLAAGSDMRVRYWDLDYAANSQLITGAASDPPQNPTAVSYRSRLIEGTEVVQETYGKLKSQTEDQQQPRKGPEAPPTGHHDIITDVNVCQPSQCFMITSSRDGVVKVWK